MREIIGTGFPGGTYRQVFYVADVEAAGPAVNGELQVDLDEVDFLAIFPLAKKTRARLIGTVRMYPAYRVLAKQSSNVRLGSLADTRGQIRMSAVPPYERTCSPSAPMSARCHDRTFIWCFRLLNHRLLRTKSGLGRRPMTKALPILGSL